jgi:hypothetical protein
VINQNVFWFNISVNNICRAQKISCTEDIVYYGFYLFFC